MTTTEFKKWLLDIFFPNRCPFCNCLIKWDKLCCEKCEEEIKDISSIVCNGCGKMNCICNNVIYDKCYVISPYDNKARQGIINLKLNNGFNCAEYYAKKLVNNIKANNDVIDYIIPVPMTKSKIHKRGYNQAEIIANFISETLNLTVRTDVLYKLNSNIEQHNLTEEQRKKNASEIFYINDINLQGKVVLLCDDVITTGATLNSCSKLLKKAGASKVICAVCNTTLIKSQKIE